MNSRLAAAGVMVGLFLAGGVTGGAVVHYVERADSRAAVTSRDRDRDRDDERRRRSPRSFATERVVESLTERLDLTPVQRDSLESILEAQRAQANTVFQEMWPRLSSTVDSANALFRRLLEPEQQARFDQLLEENRGLLGRPPPPPSREGSSQR